MQVIEIVDNIDPHPYANKPELVGTGIVRPVGLTVNGTATHFDRGDRGSHSLCGVIVSAMTDADDWVSCTRCLAIARREARA